MVFQFFCCPYKHLGHGRCHFSLPLIGSPEAENAAQDFLRVIAVSLASSKNIHVEIEREIAIPHEVQNEI
jgi:hypothetical protein